MAWNTDIAARAGKTQNYNQPVPRNVCLRALLRGGKKNSKKTLFRALAPQDLVCARISWLFIWLSCDEQCLHRDSRLRRVSLRGGIINGSNSFKIWSQFRHRKDGIVIIVLSKCIQWCNVVSFFIPNLSSLSKWSPLCLFLLSWINQQTRNTIVVADGNTEKGHFASHGPFKYMI